MKCIRQLIRQPIKTITGIILTAAAVAVLCICVGQSVATEETQDRLNEIFATIALPTADYTKEADEWALNYAAENPEVVKSVGVQSLIGTYVSELSPQNYTEQLGESPGTVANHNLFLLSNLNGEEYSSAMLEITLTEIGRVSTQWLFSNGKVIQPVDAPAAGAYVEICGVVENVIGLADGYPDYQGYTVSCQVYMPSLEALEELDLTIGKHYLIYCTDLHDSDREMRRGLLDDHPELREELERPLDPGKLSIFEEALNKKEQKSWDIVASYQFDGYLYSMTRAEFEKFQKLTCTIIDQSAMPAFDWELDGEGNPVVSVHEFRNYVAETGETITLTQGEYHKRYETPTIAYLDGTAEEFMDGEEGALWREALHNIEINSRSFPVIGVDDLSLIADVIQSKVSITVGRDFTEKELNDGAKVCILSQSLAERNGLSVGDTLTFQHFENDLGVPYQVNISEGPGSAKPVSYFFFDRTMTLQGTEKYTIIGLYNREIEWESVENNLYTFSPNTIFVPKPAVSARMDVSHRAFFRTFRLHNGAMSEFQQAASQAGYVGMFFINDNGYSVVGESLSSFQKAVKRALIVGMCIYVVVMILFFLFFPTQEKKALRVMKTLGGKRSVQLRHMICYCTAILVPGSVIGAFIGLLSWKLVVNSLIENPHSVMDVTVRTVTVLEVAGVQLIFMLLLSLATALFMTGSKNLMKQK